jgi:hypothetical protein
VRGLTTPDCIRPSPHPIAPPKNRRGGVAQVLREYKKNLILKQGFIQTT